MTEDITTRLRNACDSKNCWCPMIDEPCLDMEAAEEIERLREELEASKSAISGFIEMLGKFGKTHE